MSKWPSKKNLNKILAELENVEGTKHLNKDASSLDVFRWEICQRLIKFQQDNNLKQKELADLLDIDEPYMSRILRHRIEKVSTDKLASFLLKLEPSITLQVS